MATAISFQTSPTSLGTVSDEMFGGNFLTDRDRMDEGTYDEAIRALNLTNLRYPGGTVTEWYFDITDPDKTTGWDPNSSQWKALLPLSEFMADAAAMHVGVTMVIPTGCLLADGTLGNRVPTANAYGDVYTFVYDLLSGAYGTAKVTALEIGNEYWLGGEMHVAEYARIASVVAEASQAAIDQLKAEGKIPAWSDGPDIAVQRGQYGKYSTDVGWAQNDYLIETISDEAAAAIDAVVTHYYAAGAYDSLGNTRYRFNYLDSWNESGRFGDLQLYVTEWNVAASASDELGMRGASVMYWIFSEMVAQGVDAAHAWPIQQTTDITLTGNEGDSTLTISGEAYRMLSESVSGKELTARHDYGNGHVYVYQDGGQTVVYIASRVARATEVALDVAALGLDGYRYQATELATLGALDDPDGAPTLAIESGYTQLGTSATFDVGAYGITRVVFEGGLSIASRYIGGNSDDVLTGSAANDAMVGLGGADRLWGGHGSDLMYGGDGNDHVNGGGGYDRIFGDDGDDRLFGESANDHLEGGNGNDVIYTGGGNDVSTGDAGNDQVYDHLGNDRTWLGDGNDFFSDSWAYYDGNDQVWGGEGHDLLVARAGNDEVWGNNGHDRIYGGAGADTLNGGDGDDRLFTGIGNDIANGSVGNDQVYDYFGNDRAWLGNGNDYFSDSWAYNDGTDQVWGGEGHDLLVARAGDDQIWGNNGHDRIYGGAGADMLAGGDGDDHLFTGIGNDIAYGSVGNDQVYDQFGNDRAWLGNGNDFFSDSWVGNDGGDLVWGGDGSDLMIARSGNDQLWGDAGHDRLFGGAGSDQLYGGDGDDRLFGENEGDRLDGGDGQDVILGGAGCDTLLGGGGDDMVFGDSENDWLSGEDGDDWLDGGKGNDRIYGGNGDDRVFGGKGIDRMYGGADSDTIFGGDGDDVLFGDDGNDVLFGDDGNDWIDGGAGRDTLDGGGGHDGLLGRDGDDDLRGAGGQDKLDGGAGRDWLYGGADNDRLMGGADDDRLYGDEGDDILEGGAGRDSLYGGDGNDVLAGGADGGWLFGGAGDDTFVFESGDGLHNIYDFEAGDMIRIHGATRYEDLDVRLHGSGNVEIGFGDVSVMLIDPLDTIDAGDFLFV